MTFDVHLIDEWMINKPHDRVDFILIVAFYETEKPWMVLNKVDTHFPHIRHQRIHIIVVADPIECDARRKCLIRRQKDGVYALVYGCVCINGETDGAG